MANALAGVRLIVFLSFMGLGGPAAAREQPAAGAAQAEAAVSVVDGHKAEAAKLKPLASTAFAQAFLDATGNLPEPTARTIWRNREKNLALTPEQYEKLAEEDRAGFTKRDYPAGFFYSTGYGSPLVYARALDVLAMTEPDRWAPEKIRSKRILDFGSGTIGHLRMLASLGADATGIDVEPVFDALYSRPGDQGEVAAGEGVKGHVRFLTGRWPAENAIVERAKEGGDGGAYDLFISKNTLKRGYIHPAREVDPSRLVTLGVSDEVFVKSVHESLKPGGVFLIYNICPAQAPEDKPYLPHADGECPFPREMLEKAGFEVVKFDETDRDAILKYWMALGYNQGKDEAGTRADLFVWWTLCRKPVSRSDAKKGEIRIARNFAGEYNAEIEKIPEEDRAWPVYREARMKVVPVPGGLMEAGWPATSDQPHWARAREHFEENRDAVAIIHRAASLPRLGAKLIDRTDPVLGPYLAEHEDYEWDPTPASENPVLLATDLEHLLHFRLLARLLVMEARCSLADSDPDRFIAACSTITRVAEHCGELPTLMSAMVSQSLTNLAVRLAGDAVRDDPDLLTDADLGRLSALLSDCIEENRLKQAVEDDRKLFLDLLQRTCASDGAMTDEGLALIGEFVAWEEKERRRVPAIFGLGINGAFELEQETAAADSAAVAERTALLAEYDRVILDGLAALDTPMWKWEQVPDSTYRARFDDEAHRVKYLPVALLLPAFTKAAMSLMQNTLERDGVLVAIALESYKRMMGEYPLTLDALVPKFLARVPVDVFDGSQLKYRHAGRPLLYCVGGDRDDDLGRFSEENRFAAFVWRSSAELAAFKAGEEGARDVPDGDWVAWPAPMDR